MASDLVISTTLLNWNRSDLLQRALDSYMATITVPFELFVIDNGSTDDSPQLIERFCADNEHATAILLPENRGGEAINLGLERSRAPFVHITENDLEFMPDWVEHALSLFDAFEELGQLSVFGPTTADDETYRVRPPFDTAHRSGRVVYPSRTNVGTSSVIRRELIDAGVRIGNMKSPGSFKFPDDSKLSLDIKAQGYLAAWADYPMVTNLGHSQHEMENRREYYEENYISKSAGIDELDNRIEYNKERAVPDRTSLLFPGRKPLVEATPPRRDCLDTHLWSMFDYWTPDVETMEFVYGMTRTLKPTIAVETKARYGHMASAIGRALRANARGHLHAIEADPDGFGVTTSTLAEEGVAGWVDVLRSVDDLSLDGSLIDLLIVDDEVDDATNGDVKSGEIFRQLLAQVKRRGVVLLVGTGRLPESLIAAVGQSIGVREVSAVQIPCPRGLAILQRTEKPISR